MLNLLASIILIQGAASSTSKVGEVNLETPGSPNAQGRVESGLLTKAVDKAVTICLEVTYGGGRPERVPWLRTAIKELSDLNREISAKSKPEDKPQNRSLETVVILGQAYEKHFPGEEEMDPQTQGRFRVLAPDVLDDLRWVQRGMYLPMSAPTYYCFGGNVLGAEPIRSRWFGLSFMLAPDPKDPGVARVLNLVLAETLALSKESNRPALSHFRIQPGDRVFALRTPRETDWHQVADWRDVDRLIAELSENDRIEALIGKTRADCRVFWLHTKTFH